MSEVVFANTGARVRLDLTATGTDSGRVRYGPTVIGWRGRLRHGRRRARRAADRDRVHATVGRQRAGGSRVAAECCPAVARQVEESAQNPNGQIDFPAESFFDVFFEIELRMPSETSCCTTRTLAGPNHAERRAAGVGRDRRAYVELRGQRAAGLRERPARQRVVHASGAHGGPGKSISCPKPGPDDAGSSGVGSVPVLLSGPTTVHVFLENTGGGAFDDDGDNLDESRPRSSR